jgi:mycofactocin precursor
MPEPEAIETTPLPAEEAPPEVDELVEDELLVEDVSIDGMCGVY